MFYALLGPSTPPVIVVLTNREDSMALLLEAEDLTGDAAQVCLEGQEQGLHPLQDPVTAGDLTVQLCNVPRLADVVAHRHLFASHKLRLHLPGHGKLLKSQTYSQ